MISKVSCCTLGKQGPVAGSSRTVGGGPVVPSLGAECTDAHEACTGPLRFPNSCGPICRICLDGI